MSGAATRSRLLELKRQADAAERGRTLLDERREALLREIAKRRAPYEEARRGVALSLGGALRLLWRARRELGGEAIGEAALAQPDVFSVTTLWRHAAGTRLPSLVNAPSAFALRYGPGGTAQTVDEAAWAFARLVPEITVLADAEGALTALGAALARTNRRLNALENVLLPRLEAERREIETSLEEEERDAAFRVKRLFSGGRARVTRLGAPPPGRATRRAAPAGRRSEAPSPG